MKIIHEISNVQLVQFENGNYGILDHGVQVYPETKSQRAAIRQFKATYC